MSRSARSLLRRVTGVAVPVVIGVFSVALVLGPPFERAPLPLLGVLVAVGHAVALWWRRSRPELVTALVIAGWLVVQLMAPEGLIPFAGMMAVGSLAAARPPQVSVPALLALSGAVAVSLRTEPLEDVLFGMALAVVAWALGEATRNRRAAIEQEARRAVGEEQARIARELHDVIAHSVSVIVVQAAAADDVFDERPDQARAALRSIESAGRDALGELRRLLAVVRPGTGDELPHPQPGLDRLGELADPLRAAGLEVAVRREDPAGGTLPAGVDLSAYRIVQEALTNTLRHADASRAEVTVRSAAGVLELDVRDDGRGGTADAADATGRGSGRGIAGMRERAAMLGGTLEAGPLAGGGFRVSARLPLRTR